jgi:hypothetical protein
MYGKSYFDRSISSRGLDKGLDFWLPFEQNFVQNKLNLPIGQIALITAISYNWKQPCRRRGDVRVNV